MPHHSFRAILFDLGGTLMYAPDAWPPVFERADRELAQYLCAQEIGLDCESFPALFRKKLDEYYAVREINLFETTYLLILRELLKDLGYNDVPDQILRGALDQMFAITQTNWRLEEDAIPTLKALERDGYRLGLVSNAGDHKDVLQLVEKFKIDVYFDFILTSAGCGYRKPHSRIFELALSNWYFLPEDAAMVGDTLEADIAGANDMGIYSIWISRRANSQPGDQDKVQPDADVRALSEIPSLLKNS